MSAPDLVADSSPALVSAPVSSITTTALRPRFLQSVAADMAANGARYCISHDSPDSAAMTVVFAPAVVP